MARAKLQDYLKHFFGGADKDGKRFAAVNYAHVIHESGYEVKFSRHSVSYNDGNQIVNLEAEFDADGLRIFRSQNADTEVLAKIQAALSHLGVSHVIE